MRLQVHPCWPDTRMVSLSGQAGSHPGKVEEFVSILSDPLVERLEQLVLFVHHALRAGISRDLALRMRPEAWAR